MSKIDEFKKFVSNHPNLISVVNLKKKSWQELFEIFDLYGSDEKLWKKYLANLDSVKETGNTGISELTKLFKNINIESVRKYIDTAQKAIGIIQEFTGNSTTSPIDNGPTSPRPIDKIFED